MGSHTGLAEQAPCRFGSELPPSRVLTSPVQHELGDAPVTGDNHLPSTVGTGPKHKRRDLLDYVAAPSPELHTLPTAMVIKTLGACAACRYAYLRTFHCLLARSDD